MSDRAENIALLVELLILGMRRMAEFGEAINRMRAGGPEVSQQEIDRAGLAAEASILRARAQLDASEE